MSEQNADEMKSETLAEIDEVARALGVCLSADDARTVAQRLAKIRAHVLADELERRRLQAEIMRSANANGSRVFEDAAVVHVLGLPMGWQLAPQKARNIARLMAPRSICGETAPGTLASEMTCQRPVGHTGQHCPIYGCKVHDEGHS